jgi:hypothetical protein
MPRLLFRGAFIRFVDLRYDEKSKTPYIKINFTASFSKPVREAMEWGEPPAGYGSADLDGDFSATHFVLTPNGRELKDSEIELKAKSIGDFVLFRVKGDDGDSTHHELRFQILTSDEESGRKLQDYIKVIGKGEALLRVNYAVQSELELEAEAAAEEQPEAEPEAEPEEQPEAEPARGRRTKVRSPELVT